MKISTVIKRTGEKVNYDRQKICNAISQANKSVDSPISEEKISKIVDMIEYVIDNAYTEEIVGWSIGPTLDTTYPIQALVMALKRIEGQKNINLIHHSDRGCQYASTRYIKLLKDNNIRISMTETE